MAMSSLATEMSYPLSRGRPSTDPPRPITTWRSARSLTSTTRRQPIRLGSMLRRFNPRASRASVVRRPSWYQRASMAAATRLCATEMACMSPVRWRLNSSIGTTWLYPPPAAPPLIPNVGPMLGCRMQAIALCPRAPRPWTSPTVVVVLPSPSGVGVMAVTSTYLPMGLPAIRRRASRWIFALEAP